MREGKSIKMSLALAIVAALMALCHKGYAAPPPGQGGAEETEAVERKGPLAALPSKPGPHMAKIEALGDGESLILESPAPDPKWGRAGGRGWGMCALIHAPELGGAFFFGEGPHAHVKPDGYAMDDLWFLDFNANRWICLHPGTHPATFSKDVASGKLKADNLGRLVDQDMIIFMPVKKRGGKTFHYGFDPEDGQWYWLELPYRVGDKTVFPSEGYDWSGALNYDAEAKIVMLSTRVRGAASRVWLLKLDRKTAKMTPME